MRLRVVLTPVLFVPIAILNGIIRQAGYGRFLSERAAHQLSTLFGSLAFVGFAYAMLKGFAARLTNRTLLAIGLGWAAFTMLFEFGFGHFVMGNPWPKLLRDYDIRRGRIWSLMLLTILFAPLLVKYTMLRREGGEPRTTT